MSPIKRDDIKENRKVLYEHWKSIPAVSLINVEKDIIEKHISRPAILRILRRGIKDPDTGLKRHALNVKEIRSSLAKSDVKMSITGLYFHLKVLLQNNIIQRVATLLEKRHKVAYYGRVSRQMLMGDTAERIQKYEKRFTEFSKLIKAVNPHVKVTGVKKLARRYLAVKRKREKALAGFLETHEDIIDNKEIDPYKVYEFLKIIDAMNSDVHAILSEISLLFQVNPDNY